MDDTLWDVVVKLGVAVVFAGVGYVGYNLIRSGDVLARRPTVPEITAQPQFQVPKSAMKFHYQPVQVAPVQIGFQTRPGQ